MISLCVRVKGHINDCPQKYLSGFNMPIMSGRKKSRWRLPVGNSLLFWFYRSVLKKERLVKHWTPALKVPVLS